MSLIAASPAAQPPCQGVTVRQSGLFPSIPYKPLGFLTEGMLHSVKILPY